MRISQDKEKYMKYYLAYICFQGELRLSNIEQMVKFKGQGAEYVSCSFDPDDEDYKEGYVTLTFWEPADDEDTMVFVENSMFYEEIEKICNEYIKKNPKDEKYVNNCLQMIKNMLNV